MGDLGPVGVYLVLIAVLAGVVLLAIGCVLLATRLIARDLSPEHNSVLSPFLTVVGLIYGAMLGFTVVVGWQQFLTARTNVTNEASALITLYHHTAAMPQPEQSQLREELRKYALAVQGPEWDRQQTGAVSTEARGEVTQMYRIVADPRWNSAANPVNNQALDELTNLVSDRAERILDAETRVPLLLWGALIFGGMMLIVLASFMRLANLRSHMILVSSIAVLLGLMLFLIYALDHPLGRVGVSPKPFRHALVVFDTVDAEK
ncbi:hypothetical protein A5662_26645 [Mycobacteriaceae bacterium 1482268.1]|nr:hypothetical protein A5662_26645 [Mycobacteriaceae bacterium 1482268.1]